MTDITVVGAGIAGLSCAYFLNKLLPDKKICILESESRVMGLTSSASAGGFRNFYYMSKSMTNLSNRSIDLIKDLVKESKSNLDYAIDLSQSGYIFLSSNSEQLSTYIQQALAARANGSGPVRYNNFLFDENMPLSSYSNVENFDFAAYKSREDGIDIIDAPHIIRKLIPECVTESVKCMMNIRKAGYLDPEALGEYLHQKLLHSGNVTIKTSTRMTGITYTEPTAENPKKHVRSIKIRGVGDEEGELQTHSVILCPGPYLKEAGKIVGVDFPVVNEAHARVAISDPAHIIPSPPDCPFLVWSDDISISLTPSEQAAIATTSETYGYLEKPLGVGIHCRPLTAIETSRMNYPSTDRRFLGIWTHDLIQTFESPPPMPAFIPPLRTTIILRGLCNMMPDLRQYADREPPKIHSGNSEIPLDLYPDITSMKTGYYCKTSRNIPIIGPISQLSIDNGTNVCVDGLFVGAALSGIGIMISAGVGEILAKWVKAWFKEENLVPAYAQEFTLENIRKVDTGFNQEFITQGQM